MLLTPKLLKLYVCNEYVWYVITVCEEQLSVI